MGDTRRWLAAGIAAVLLAGVASAGATVDRAPAAAATTTAATDGTNPAATSAPPPAATATAAAAAPSAADTATPGAAGDTMPDVQVTAPCDDLDPAACLLPWPNDVFTIANARTDTGKRVHLDLLSMPRNVAGLPIGPTEWNRNDGFSPGSAVLTRVPGLDLHATWGSDLDHLQDLSWYTRPDAPIVLLDADTGLRHPFWSELDTNPGTSEDERLLILRPAVNLTEGHRYIVALRDLRTAEGTPIEATAAFAAHRDGTADPGAARTQDLEEIFDTLARAGIARDDLFLAWDFTVASERNLTERVLAMRDQTFAALGDTDLADGRIEGDAPRFTIDTVEDLDPTEGPSRRRITGTVTVPNYLTPQAEVGITGPLAGPVEQLLDALPETPVDDLGLPIGPDDLVGQDFMPLFSRFNAIGADHTIPAVNPVQPTVEVPFTCHISRSGTTPMIYGHGLLGSRAEVEGSSTRALRERGFSPCAMDWWGMSTADLAVVATILVDAAAFPTLPDRAQQGFLNMLVLGRAIAHPDGFASHPAFQDADGNPAIDPSALVYDGNSQGAIMGGALTALAPDFTRSVLGVPGMNYSTLLNRSVDWEGVYSRIAYAAYPSAIDQQLFFGLVQMLWDRAEANGYAHHMTGDPLPNTPPHEVFLQVAFADHQVANVTAEVEARTIGARLLTPGVAAGRHWSVDPAFGLGTVDGDTPDAGSVLVYWFTTDRDLHTPPNGNVPMRDGSDPHGDPRKYGPATDQVAHWLRTGDLLDVCGPDPCELPRQ